MSQANTRLKQQEGLKIMGGEGTKVSSEIVGVRCRLDDWCKLPPLQRAEKAEEFVVAIQELDSIHQNPTYREYRQLIENLKTTYLRRFVQSMKDLLDVNADVERWSQVLIASFHLRDEIKLAIADDQLLIETYDRYWRDPYTDFIKDLLQRMPGSRS